MNFLKKAAFCYVAPLLSIFSVATTQLEAQACCDPNPCSIDWCSLLVPALVGAAAGAATAACIKNKGKHGKRGERGEKGEGERGRRGPEGANPFDHDLAHSLTFTFIVNSITFAGEDGGPSVITPYVATPDGRIFTATPISFVNSGTSVVTSVTIANPAYGTFVFGLQFPAHPSDVTVVYDLLASNPDRIPTEYQDSILLPANAELVQLGFDFVYGSPGSVPSSPTL